MTFLIVNYLPLEDETSGLASSESFLMATAFLILFIALPPTLALLLKLGLLWLEDTKRVKKQALVYDYKFMQPVFRNMRDKRKTLCK